MVIIFVKSISANDTWKWQGASSGGEAKQQRAGRIFVFRVVLNDLGLCAGLADLLLADVALHGPTEGVSAEFKLACHQLPSDVLQRFHCLSLSVSRPMG